MRQNPIPPGTALYQHILDNVYKIEERHQVNLSDTDWFKLISKTDPSESGKYGIWVFRQLLLGNRGGGADIEDLFKLHEQLIEFDELKSQKLIRGVRADIGRYNAKSLYRLLEKYREGGRFSWFTSMDVGEIVYEDEKYLIFKTTDYRTVRRLARDTNWCVSGEDYAVEYLDQGPLYFMFEKEEGGALQKFALIHFESEQMMGTDDEEVYVPTKEVHEFLKSIDPYDIKEEWPFYETPFRLVTESGEIPIIDFEFEADTYRDANKLTFEIDGKQYCYFIIDNLSTYYDTELRLIKEHELQKGLRIKDSFTIEPYNFYGTFYYISCDDLDKLRRSYGAHITLGKRLTVKRS